MCGELNKELIHLVEERLPILWWQGLPARISGMRMRANSRRRERRGRARSVGHRRR
ncbi:MAG: hypothetical protein JNL84_03605 [Candidatus Accumulibacter sp.]|nr:hypothetical protein [Accumulibacter sp.]